MADVLVDATSIPLGDQPILFVFSNPPTSLEVSSNGDAVTFFFESSAGRVALVQPWEKYYHLLDTSRWSGISLVEEGAKGPPAEAVRLCQRWAELLQSFPLDVTETYTVKKDGTVVIREEFSYLHLKPGEGKKVWMPVPPLWAVAREEGSPLEFSGQLVDTGVYTYAGPYKVIEGDGSYQVRVVDLSKYWCERRVVEARAPEWLNPVEQELRREVERVVSAGHLAPWFYLPYKKMPVLVWKHSGETAYYLSQCLPVLPRKLANRTVEYILRESEKYPIDGDGCFLKSSEGVRREWGNTKPYRSEGWDRYFVSRDFYAKQNLPPSETTYYLVPICEQKGNAKEHIDLACEIVCSELYRLDWATGSFLAGKKGNRVATRRQWSLRGS